MRQSRLACLALALAANVGCASVMHGRIQQVTVTSEPSEATLFVNGTRVGLTPISIVVKRRAKEVLRIEKDGFATEQLLLERTLSRWLGGDVALAMNPMAAQGMTSEQAARWPLYALTAAGFYAGFDFMTGAAYTHPSSVHIVLTPK